MQSSKETHAQHELSQKAYELKQGILPTAHGVRLLRRPEVEVRTGLSRSTLYAWMKQGEFPQPVKLGERLVAWRESDIAAWLNSRETRVG